MSNNYTITVTDSLGATATMLLFIDITNPDIPVLIFNPVLKDAYALLESLIVYDNIVEPEIVKLVERVDIVDVMPVAFNMVEVLIFTDSISGGEGGS